MQAKFIHGGGGGGSGSVAPPTIRIKKRPRNRARGVVIKHREDIGSSPSCSKPQELCSEEGGRGVGARTNKECPRFLLQHA